MIFLDLTMFLPHVQKGISRDGAEGIRKKSWTSRFSCIVEWSAAAERELLVLTTM